MKINKIKLENYRSHKLTEVSFNDQGIIGILGKTGHGKSALIESIFYAIYGQYRDKNEDSLIRDGEDTMSVLINFNHKMKEVEIERKKKKGSSSKISFKIDGSEQSVTGGSRSGNQLIQEFIGIDYDTFIGICFFRQKLGEEFLSATPSIRRKYLSSILNTNKVAIASEKSKKRRIDLNQEYLLCQGKIVSKKERIAKFNVDELKQSIINNQSIIDNCSSSIEKLEEEVSQLRKKESEIRELGIRASFIVGKINSCRNEIITYRKEIPILTARIERQNQLLEKFQNEYSVWEDENNRLQLLRPKELIDTNIYSYKVGDVESQINSLIRVNNEINSLGPVCQKCRSKIDDSHKSLIISENNTLIVELNEQKIEYKKKIEEGEAQKKILYEIMSHGGKKPQGSKEQFLSTIRDSIEILKTREEKLKACVLTEAQLEEELKALPRSDETLSSISDKINQINRKITENRSTSSSSLMLIQKAKDSIEIIEKETEELRIHTAELERLGNDVIAMNQIVDIFSIKIPAMLIENVLSTLTNYANSLLSEFETGFQVFINTQKENSTGELRETLNIEIKNSNGSIRGYESFSGGQKSIINFSIRLALAIMLSLSSGVSLRSIILDEVFSDLDNENLEIMMSVLNVLRQSFDQIIMVTHIESLKQHMPQILEVEIEDGVSVVR